MERKIKGILKKAGEPLTQREIAKSLPGVNRAILLGYLRALVDVKRIKSKDSGRAKIYFL